MKTILTFAILFLSFGSVYGQNEAYYDQLFDSVSAEGTQQEGIQYFEQELKKFPKNEIILRSLGALNYQLRNYTETKKYYDQALVVNPDCAQCYFYIAQYYAFLNDINGAYASIEKGLKIDPKNSMLYTTRAKLRLYQGNENDGLSDLSKAILYDNTDALPYLERANYYMNRGVIQLAKSDLVKAMKIEPDNLLVYNYLTQLYGQEGDFLNALATINKALELDSLNAKNLITRGEVYFMMEDFDKAASDYQKAKELDPKDYMASSYLAEVYYKQERMDEYCTEMSRTLQLMEMSEQKNEEQYAYFRAQIKDLCDINQASYYYQRGIALFNLGKPLEAIAFYNQAISKFPEEYMTYSFKGNAELLALNNRQAITDYNTSLAHIDAITVSMTKNPNNAFGPDKDSVDFLTKAYKASTYLSLAYCYFNLGKTDSAVYCINTSIQNSPNSNEFSLGGEQFVKGFLHMDKGEFSMGEKAFLEAFQRSPEWSFSCSYIALSKIALGLGLSKLNRNDVQITQFEEMGNVYWKLPEKAKVKDMAKLNEAMTYLDKSIVLNPENPLSLYLRGYLKKLLGFAYCEDFKQANTFGYPVELVYLKKCSN